MRNARGWGVLAVPAAVSLAGVLVVACMGGNPTAPDGANAPSLAQSKSQYYDDARRPGSCSGNDPILAPTDVDYVAAYDLNNNDRICLKTSGPGPRK